MPHALSSSVVIYLGPARSGKTQELVREYAQVLEHGSLSPRGGAESRSGATASNQNLWLAPNARAAAEVRSQLLASGLHACLRPGVMTFHELTGLILADAKLRLRSLRPVMQRALLRRVVEQAAEKDEFKYFADASRRSAFIDLLADHIHELQRSDISPAAYSKARLPQANADEHRELALLYAEYENLLARHSLTDEEGSYRAARDALAAGEANTFRNLDLIVADGFTDFTRTQHDILRLLAVQAQRLLIALPSDPCDVSAPRTGRLSNQSEAPGGPAQQDAPRPRADLFAKIAATLHELKHHHPRLEIREFPTRPHNWPALDHVLQHVFRNPNQLPAPSTDAIESLDRLRIVAGASVQDEIVQIARRIKSQLAAAAARPGDIVVVFRSLSDVAPRVREVFDQFGIPYSLESSLPIATAPVVQTLLDLLRLDGENWPFRRVVSVITNNMLTAFDGLARQSAEWLVRESQLADGSDKLLARVEKLASIETPLKQLSEHAAQRVSAAQAALPLFQLLAQSLDNLPKVATPREWCAALAELANQLGLHETSDSVAWRLIESHFVALERLDQWLDSPPRKLSRGDLISTFVDVASRESRPRAHDDVGRVRIVAAPAVRTISTKHLYLAGMSEQSFPSPEPAGRLGTASDYRALARAADQVWAVAAAKGPSAPTRSQDEMLLFYEVLSRAEESLTISYPALDDKAQDLPPSPYVLEIQRVFGSDFAEQLKPAPPQLSPIPQGRSGEPSRSASGTYSIADWRIQAVARAIGQESDRRSLAGIFSSPSTGQLASAIDAGLRIVHERGHGESFGPAEGLLTSPAVAARLAKKYGADRLWSPSQWEKYAACPYKFFLDDVLKIVPLGDLVVETDKSRRGSRMHDVLAAFHRAWPALRGKGAMTEEDERAQFLDYFDRVIDERIDVNADGGIDAALTELDRRQIRKWAEKHFDHHLKYDSTYSQRGVAMTPTHFEFRFGPSRVGDSEHDPDSIDKAFVIDVDGERVRVTGQIDRIDVGTIDGKTVFNVIDYKSGKSSTLRDADIASGERLQLPLYVEAAQMLVFDGNATPIAAGYWSTTSGFDAKGALAVEVEGDASERWKRVRGTVEERIGEFVHGIRHGAFPVASRDDQCTSYCDFRTVCRIAQVRSLGKIQAESQESSVESQAPNSPQPPAPSP